MAKAKAKAKAKTKTKVKPKAVAKPKAAAKKTAKTSKVATLKTAATRASVDDFLRSLDAERAAECKELVSMMRKATGATPRMWGASIVGFGDWHYKYATGREGDFFQVGFSPRKAALTLYINGGYEKHTALLAKLGKHSIGKSCLYVKRLDDVDRGVLKQIIDLGVADLAKLTAAQA